MVGRRYRLGGRPVVVVTGWGPGARVRNVRVRFLDDGTEVIRPFRGLRRERDVDAVAAVGPVRPPGS